MTSSATEILGALYPVMYLGATRRWPNLEVGEFDDAVRAVATKLPGKSADKLDAPLLAELTRRHGKPKST